MFNARSLVNKLSKFQSFVYSNPIDVYCITESWLSNSIFDNEILPSGYSIFCKNRGSRGGGILVAVADSIPTKLIPSPPNLQARTIMISYSNRQILLCCVYIPPNPDAHYFHSYVSYLSNLATSYESIIFLGDFNLPDIIWSSLSCSSSNSNLLCDFIFQHNLSQLIESPTHIQGNTLDLVLTNNLELVSDISIHPHLSHTLTSDHFIISFTVTPFSLPSLRNEPIYVFDYPKADLLGLCDYLLSSDLSLCLSTNDIELVWSTLKNFIYLAMDLFIPKIRLRSHQRPKWITPTLQHDVNCFRTLKRNINLMLLNIT